MRNAVKYGVLLGGGVGAWTVVVHMLGVYTTRLQYAEATDRVALILPVVVLALALLKERDRRGGTLSVGQGVLTGLGVSLVAAPIGVAALWIYHHLINPQWLALLVAYKRQQLSAMGVSPDEIAAATERLQQSGADQQQVIGGLIGTVAVGLVLSIIIAAVLKFLRPVQRASF